MSIIGLRLNQLKMLMVSVRRGLLSTAPIFALLFSVPVTVQGATEAYRINSEDLLEISVWKEEDLQKTVAVRPDGGITLPLIGNVQAAGMTTEELQQALTEKLDEYIPDPVVTVSVAEIRGYKIYITGEVQNPGEYLMGTYIDVLQALTLAGGVTPFADKNDIRILRRNGASESILKFDYNQVQKGRKLEQNIILKAGDTIIVP